jgi:hypothetical protein
LRQRSRLSLFDAKNFKKSPFFQKIGVFIFSAIRYDNAVAAKNALTRDAVRRAGDKRRAGVRFLAPSQRTAFAAPHNLHEKKGKRKCKFIR